MRNALRCCISCILPCGALDVIRIVHANGRVEEISGSIKAEEIMKAYPKHVLKKPSTSSEEGMCPKIVIVPPDAQLQRGKIYFLMPLPSPPQKTRSRSSTRSSNKKKLRKEAETIHASNNNNIAAMADLLSTTSDRYLSEILSENLSTQRDRRRSRAAVWRPHLESISETPSEA